MLGPWSLAAARRYVARDSRRLRLVARDPQRATHADIELLVRAHAAPEQKVWAVVDRLLADDLDPTLVWAWTMCHDGVELADLCASRLTGRELVEILSELGASGVYAAA